MTCEQMRAMLLTADLEELRGEGSGDLAAHLGTCAACRADAARILSGTMRLGAAVRGRARRRAAAIIVSLAMAAGITLFVLVRPRVGVVTTVASSASAIPATTAVHAPATAPSAPVVPAAGSKPRRLPHLVPIDAIPVMAVGYTPSSFAPQALQAAHPAAARRRTVLHPTDPNITVLWFE